MLLQIPLLGRTMHYCRHGRALALSALRDWVKEDSLLELEEATSPARGKPGLPCPHCGKKMKHSNAKSFPLQHCRACAISWLKNAEFERLPLKPVGEIKQPGVFPLQLRVDPNVAELKEAVSPFENIERGEAQAPLMTIFIVFACAAITYIAQHTHAPGLFVFDPTRPFHFFGLPILLSAFAHAGTFHLLGNMFYLFFAGSIIESSLGWKVVLQVLLVSYAGDCIAYSLLSSQPALGASGAISGIIMVLVATQPKGQYVYRLSDVIPGFFFSPFSLRMPLWLWAASWCAMQSFGFFQGLSGKSDGVAYAAHLGGAAAGLILAWVMDYKIKPLAG